MNYLLVIIERCTKDLLQKVRGDYMEIQEFIHYNI